MNKEVGVLFGDWGGGGVGFVFRYLWINLLIYVVVII